MECMECGEQQDQETIDEAIVEGTANEMFVCLGCLCDVCGRADKYAKTSDYGECQSCEGDRESSQEDSSDPGPLLSLAEQHLAAWLQEEGR